MIARILIPILLMILPADIYIDRVLIRRMRRHQLTARAVLWATTALIVAYTLYMALLPDFAPRDERIMNIYLLLLGLVVVPKFLFFICALIGCGFRLLSKSRRNYGHVVGSLLVLTVWYILIYGVTIGFNKLNVNHIDFYSNDIPQAFDGYRIVQFSDAHVGTFRGSNQQLLKRDIDSINAQMADAIVFVGDLQNLEPSELTPHAALLGSLRAQDGVFSVLGNHDYAVYIQADPATKERNCLVMRERQREFGWTLLNNDHRIIRRGSDSIVIAGMENYGTHFRSPKRGNARQAVKGVSPRAFTVMLEHDPTAWREKVLPQTAAQLTLSGHTHAMQFALFGWSPASFVYKEWGGLYYSGDRALNISTGMGGFLPFRFGVTAEIVVITLHKKKG